LKPSPKAGDSLKSIFALFALFAPWSPHFEVSKHCPSSTYVHKLRHRCSADWQSAVSPIANRQYVRKNWRGARPRFAPAGGYGLRQPAPPKLGDGGSSGAFPIRRLSHIVAADCTDVQLFAPSLH